MVRNNSLPDSAGFLIRFGCRFTASRANSASPQTVPLVAVASPNLIDGTCAGIRSISLFISCFRLVNINFLVFCISSLHIWVSPIHPAEANGPGELRSPQDRCGVGTLSLLESSYAASPLKYGARWNKRRTPGEGFSGLFSGIGSLKNFV